MKHTIFPFSSLTPAYSLLLACTWLLAPLAVVAGNTDKLINISEEKQLIIDRYKSLQTKINENKDHFFIESSVTGGSATGEVYGVLPYSIQSLETVLTSTEHWCNATIIHINIKSCIIDRPDTGSPVITLYVADEDYTEPELAEKIQYRFKIHTDSPEYIHITLSATSGPLDSGSSSIDIKAVKLGGQSSLVSLDYSMHIGAFSRAILSTYLATLGRNKVGFTETTESTKTVPKYIGGIAGVMERNTMRYYFAFDAYLAALKEPDNKKFPAALNHWFNYTEKYRKQLYEIERPEYIKRKNKERQNQILLQAKTTGSFP